MDSAKKMLSRWDRALYNYYTNISPNVNKIKGCKNNMEWFLAEVDGFIPYNCLIHSAITRNHSSTQFLNDCISENSYIRAGTYYIVKMSPPELEIKYKKWLRF